jgi:hypothetical protein
VSRRPIWIALLAGAVLIAGSLQITRVGYSLDEEFTVFAVRGIQQHGLPLLPSGLLYDRGIAYSYASAVAGLLTGSELPAYRAIGTVSAALVVVLAFLLVRRLAGEAPALLAPLLVMTAVPFWATATSARFYVPFFALYLGTLLSMQSSLALIVALALLCRLTHELAFTLAAVPFLCAIVLRDERRRWLLVTIAVIVGLVIGQAMLFAFHYLAPTNGDTMVRRFFLWQVLNLFERPGDRQFMIPVVVMVVGVIVAPRKAWLNSVVALSIAAMILAFSIARATNSATLSAALVQAILVEGSRYPMDMFWHIASTTPLTLLLAIAGLAARAAGRGGDWPRSERVLHLLWIGWVLWFGVIESGITTNYLLLPVSFMLMAIAVDLDAVRRHCFSPSRQAASFALVALIVAGVFDDQWRGAGSIVARLEVARPTIHVEGLAEIRDGLEPADRIVCTDELGCLMLIGRIDRWLALDDYVRERFLVRRGDAPVTGVYTGVPAAFRPADLFAPFDSADVERGLAQGRPLEAGSLPARILIVDLFKEYPIGNSRSWLPKAIEEDGLQVVPLLETAQLRVLEVSRPEALAILSERVGASPGSH